MSDSMFETSVKFLEDSLHLDWHTELPLIESHNPNIQSSQ